MEINTNPEISSETKLLELLRKQDKSRQDQIIPDFRDDGFRKKKSNRPDVPYLRYLNAVLLTAGFVLLMAVGLGQLISKPVQIVEDEGTGEMTYASKNGDIISEQFKRPFSLYEGALKTRDIFASPDELKGQAKAVDIPYVEAINGRFTLVGLIIDHDPQAMIEDGQTGQTIFLKVNETVSGMKLLDIQEGKIMVDYQGQISELYYKLPDKTPNELEFVYE